MSQEVTLDLFFVSLVGLLLVLLVLLFLFWILRRSKIGNLTELHISAGRPARTLTIRTEPDHAHQLLDHLLDRVFLQGELKPESGGQSRAEPGEEHGGECDSDSGSDPGVSKAASFPSRPGNALHNKVRKWVTFAIPSPASSSASSSSSSSPSQPSPTDWDQTTDLCPQGVDASQHASLSSQGASCSAEEKQQCDESQP